MILKDVEPLKLSAYNFGEYDAESYMAGASAVLEKLDSLPVIDSESLQPVKHGKWIEEKMFDDDMAYKCSNCGEFWAIIDGTPKCNGMFFCPNCGARMDLEETE